MGIGGLSTVAVAWPQPGEENINTRQTRLTRSSHALHERMVIHFQEQNESQRKEQRSQVMSKVSMELFGIIPRYVIDQHRFELPGPSFD